MYTRTGYLFLLEKKALGTTSWQKCYCQYIRENRYGETEKCEAVKEVSFAGRSV